MWLAGQDVLHQPRRKGTHLAPPFDDARGGPLQILLVRLGAMSGVRAGGVQPAAARVTGYALALIEDLHRPTRAADFDLLADKLIRRAVVMTIKFDVIIQIHARLVPLR